MSKATGLRTEILTTITLLMGAALLLGGVLMLRLTEQSLLEQRVLQLKASSGVVANSLATLSQEYSLLDRQSIALQFLSKLPESLKYDGWWLFDKKMQLLASYQSSPETLNSVAYRQQAKISLKPVSKVIFPSLLEIFEQTEARAYFAVPILSNNRFLGLLEIGFSLNDIRERVLHAQKIILLYVFLYGAVLVSIGYYLLQRNIIKPARNLLHVTEQVGQGNLDLRLPVAGPAEITHLAEAYNQMVEALQESRQETGEHIEALEQTNFELQQARAELIRSEKLASVGQLAAGLAHELGNPLAALVGYLEFLKTKIADEENLDILKRSIVETQRIDFLVRELLDFSRPSNMLTERVDFVGEFRKSLELLEHQGVLNNLTIADLLPKESVPVKINRHKLQQVFINILLNAVHACRRGGEITVSGESRTDGVCIKIADSGCGISAEELGKVFDPFYTTKDPGEGTGLGLAICQRIIDEAGGTIDVKSKLGEGSVFSLVLKQDSSCSEPVNKEEDSKDIT